MTSGSRNQVLSEHCAAIGRDPAEITRSMQTDRPLRRPAGTGRHPGPAPGDDHAGVTHIVLAAVLAGRPVQRLADEIIGPVLAEAQHR